MKGALLALLPLATVALGLDPRGGWTRPEVESEALQEKIKLRDIMRHCRALQRISDRSEKKNRHTGTTGFENSVKYITRRLRWLRRFWDFELQPFTVTIQTRGEASLAVNGEPIEVNVMSNSPSGNFTGIEIVKVDNVGCEQSDYPSTLEGKIALVSRGECTFSSKSARAGVAGAVGALIYNNVDGPLSGTLGADPDEIGPRVPSAGMTQADGLAVADLIAGSGATADLDIDTLIETFETNNVIATSKSGDPDNMVFLGAHLDSVAAGAGINDNGSGSSALIALAMALPRFSINNRVRIAWWAAEEEGLLGAEHYVNTATPEELLKIRVYLNFDMIASPNYVLGVYDGSGGAFNVTGPPGSAETQFLYEKFFEEKGVGSVPSEFTGRSDYGPFLEAGVPCGGLFTGAGGNKTEEEAKLFGGEVGAPYDANYHTVLDDINNLNTEAFEVNAKAAAHSCATYAASFEGFPPREPATPGKYKRDYDPAHEW